MQTMRSTHPTQGLYAIKPWFVRRLRAVEDVLVARGVSADALTAAAVVAAAGAGAAIVVGRTIPLVWLVVGPLVLVRLALNALDGSVARRTGTARPFGAVLNEAGDRISDTLTIGALAFVAGPALGLGALIATLIASSAGVAALALTGHRDNAGPMGKADRQAVLAVAALWAALAPSATPFVVASIVIMAGAAVTAVARVARVRRALRGPAVGDILRTEIVEFPVPEVIDVIAG